MDELKIFENEAFGEIRVLMINNSPWFAGKDVAKVLRYTNPQKALRDHVDAEDRTVNESFTVKGTKGVLINESGLYSLILSSKQPSAKDFKRWVTSEVLPSIRSNGGYIVGQETMSDDELLARALEVAHKKIAAKQKEIERMKPKEIFADAVSASDTPMLVGELAKLLNQNGIDIGERRLFDWLRTNGYLIKRKGIDYNMPTQKSMDMGLFKIREKTITYGANVKINKTARVTSKGQQYFINKFLAQ